jgi:hypothetical protein
MYDEAAAATHLLLLMKLIADLDGLIRCNPAGGDGNEGAGEPVDSDPVVPTIGAN